jgi:hypothetical protein
MLSKTKFRRDRFGSGMCMLVCLMLLFPCALIAQQPTAKASVDRASILIGEQFTYTITATYPVDQYSLTLPDIDTIEQFEIVRRLDNDTTEANGIITCTKSVVFTSFDSGIHVIPSMMVKFDPFVDDTTINIGTDSIRINVAFSPADTVQTFHDIKPIIVVKDEIEWWLWIGGALLLLLLGFIIWKVLKNRSKRPKKVVAPALSPYDEAMNALADLSKFNLHDYKEAKQYHILLASVFKTYLRRKLGQNFSTNTTSELLLRLQSANLEQSRVGLVANALRMGDAVKFAKYHPPVDDSEHCLKIIRQTIETMN